MLYYVGRGLQKTFQSNIKSSQRLRVCECVKACVGACASAAAPRSEQSDPEAVIRLEAGSKNIKLLYYSCARRTISAPGTSEVFLHVSSRPLRRASVRIPVGIGSLHLCKNLKKKCIRRALIRPKVAERRGGGGKKAAPKVKLG